MIDFLASSLKLAKIPYKENEPLAQKSTFKVGGSARLFISPESTDQFISAISAVKAADIPYFVIGGASNIVFPDGTYPGAIISSQNLKEIYMEADSVQEDGSILISCQCGLPMAALVDFCTKKNLTGIEEFAGLPGSVGGALYMNARCFDKSISDILYSTKYFEFQGKQAVSKESLFNSSEWDYKKSPFQKPAGKFILQATFKLKQLPQSEHENILANCKKYIAERVDKGHFKYPSAGSVFKNNHAFGAPSGKIIDQCGLKGLQVGGAQIAPFHGNFIINTGNATAADIKTLVEKVQATVKEQLGFLLEPEIIFI